MQLSKMMTQIFTVAEKILYHLFQYIKSEEKYEVPFDVTQDGIAQSCGISRAHAAIELKKLKEGQQIVEKLSHVRRAKSRRKVYFLTSIGKERAGKIVDHVRAENVATGVDPSRISQDSGPAKRMKKHISAIPLPKSFFGRRDELRVLNDFVEDDSSEMAVIVGLEGIGKTTLLARYAKESKSSVFWYSLNDWETDLSLFRSLAGFLEDCGDARLSNYLKSESFDLGEVGYLLAESLSENRRILIFDDVDKAPRLQAIVRMVIQNAGPNKVFLSAESVPQMMDDLKSTGRVVKEILIEGLDSQASCDLLRTRGIAEDKAAQLHALTGGHPLLLGLIPLGDESTAKMEIGKFVKRTLLKELPARDMAIVERCSILRKPFQPSYVSREERGILNLPIFYQISGSYFMHDAIRRMVSDQMPLPESKEYHSGAADYYLSQGNVTERLFHLVSAGRYPEAERLIHAHSDDLLAEESAENLVKEIEAIPPSMSKYAPSVRIMLARATSSMGNEPEAIDSLLKIYPKLNGEDRTNALIELSTKPLDGSRRKRVLKELEGTLSDQELNPKMRSRAALSLAKSKYLNQEFEVCEKIVEKGLSFAANSFSLDTICPLNRLMGQILISRQKYPKAIAYLSQTAPSYDGEHRPLFHRLLAKAMAEVGKNEEARINLESSVALAEQSGLFKELADSLLELSNLKLKDNDFEGAAESCYRCIEVSQSIGEKILVSTAYGFLSGIEARRGNQKEAEENRVLSESALKAP